MKPDPTLSYLNGELRFWLGWAQEVAGDHGGARESRHQARSELESLLKEQPENYLLIVDLALINMGLGDKAAALALSGRAMAVNPIEKDAFTGPRSLEILARVAAQMGEPDRAISALQNIFGTVFVPSPVKRRLLQHCSGSIRCSIHSGMIPASKNSARKTKIISPTSAEGPAWQATDHTDSTDNPPLHEATARRARITRIQDHSERSGMPRPRCCKSGDNCRASVSDANRIQVAAPTALQSVTSA